MATISDLIGLLFPILNLHASPLVRHAGQLRVAGFLPAEDENLTALEAATFLAAVTGARAPTEAVEAARVFASLPLIAGEDHREDPATGATGGMRTAIDKLPAPPETVAPLLTSAKRSFVAALEFCIHRAQAPDRKPEELPSAIAIMRNLEFPVALIAFGRAETDGVWRETRLLFAPSDAASRAGSARSRRMQVWAYLPVITIPLLGDLLADRLDVIAEGRDARPGMAAVFDQLGGKWYSYRRLDPFASLLGPVADFVELSKQIPSTDRDKLGAAVITALTSNLINKTYLPASAISQLPFTTLNSMASG